MLSSNHEFRFLFVSQVGLVGSPVDLTYKYEHLGSDPAALVALAAGQNPFLERLKKAARPAVIVGPGVLRRPDREAVMKAVHDLCSEAGRWSACRGRQWMRHAASASWIFAFHLRLSMALRAALRRGEGLS